MYVVEAKNINKRYGGGQDALVDFSLSLRQGRTMALLGVNGAGKTTFVKLILNLVRPTSGTLLLNGLPPTSPLSRIKTAYLPENFQFFPYYRVIDTVRFYGKMAGLKGDVLKDEIARAMATVKIDKDAEKKIKHLSKGMLQRVGIACVLVGSNDFFIFDEPFSGLDPLGIKDFKDIVLELKKQGKSILMSSHILAETEQVCDDIAIIQEGVLLEYGENGVVNGEESLEDFFYRKVQSR